MNVLLARAIHLKNGKHNIATLTLTMLTTYTKFLSMHRQACIQTAWIKTLVYCYSYKHATLNSFSSLLIWFDFDQLKKKKEEIPTQWNKQILCRRLIAKHRIYEERLYQHSCKILRADIIKNGQLWIWVHFHRMQFLSQYYFDKKWAWEKI